MPKRASQAFQSHGLHPFWGCGWHLEFAKSMAKCVFIGYGPSLEPLFAIMCSTACILHDIFTFSQCFRHHFAEKWTLLKEINIAQIWKANTTCEICEHVPFVLYLASRRQYAHGTEVKLAQKADHLSNDVTRSTCPTT